MSEMSQERRDQVSAEQFVTYKWLIATVISVLGLMVGLIVVLIGSVNANMGNKVNMELYNAQYRSQCETIDSIKGTVDANGKMMERFNQNQVLVMRALKIEPVR